MQPTEPVRWKVLEGAGGRLVREGFELNSAEQSQKLEPGALVQQLELRGNRLRYWRLTGRGPETGWVTIISKIGVLLERVFKPIATGTEGPNDRQVWILTTGTRGDLQPFVVLALALHEAGFSVRLFGPPELHCFSAVENPSGIRFTEACRGWSNEAEKLKPDDSEKEDQHTTKQDAEKESDPSEIAAHKVEEQRKPTEAEIASFKTLCARIGVDITNGGDVAHMAWLWTEMPKVLGIVAKELDLGVPDLIIYNHLMVNVGVWAGRKYCVRTLFANLGMEFHIAPQGKDVFNHKTLSAFDTFVVKRLTGISPVAEMDEHQFAAMYSSPGRLLGTTKLIKDILSEDDQEKAATWKFTGYWVFEESRQLEDTRACGTPQEFQKLCDFVVDGAPPVYVGFGSMLFPPSLMATIIAALRRLDKRAVIARGWCEMSAEEIRAACIATEGELGDGLAEFASKNTIFIDKAPHEWLFPRCSCTVHHGGAGTTSAALRAGVPTVVVPFCYDQFFHADFVVKLGCGVKAKQAREADVCDFVDALHRATLDDGMQIRAKAVAATLRSEPGVSAAVASIRWIIEDEVWTGKFKKSWEDERQIRQGTETLKLAKHKKQATVS